MIRRFGRDGDAPLTCRDVGKLLQSYLDDEIDAAQAAKITDHLEACRACGLDADTYRRIKASLAGTMPEVDAAAVARLRSFGDTLTADGA